MIRLETRPVIQFECPDCRYRVMMAQQGSVRPTVYYLRADLPSLEKVSCPCGKTTFNFRVNVKSRLQISMVPMEWLEDSDA